MFGLFHITNLDKLIIGKISGLFPRFIFMGVDMTLYCYLFIIGMVINQYIIIQNEYKKVH